MEYKRKNRWANYDSEKCKEYLRNDFSYECAYCKLTERACGVIGSEFFEVDHFHPQSDSNNTPEIHCYNNLFYSCKKCNSEKSDFWSDDLLNPCESDIFRNNAHISGGDELSSHFRYNNVTTQGALYLRIFKLNSRYHLRIRKRRSEYKNNIRIINDLIDEILNKITSKHTIPDKDHLINQLDQLRIEKEKSIEELMRDENFEKVHSILEAKNIRNSIIMEEYNLDYKINCNGRSIYCELIVDYTEREEEQRIKYIDKNRIEAWLTLETKIIGILFYYPKLNTLYLFCVSDHINKSNLNEINIKYCVRLSEENLL